MSARQGVAVPERAHAVVAATGDAFLAESERVGAGEGRRGGLHADHRRRHGGLRRTAEAQDEG